MVKSRGKTVIKGLDVPIYETVPQLEMHVKKQDSLKLEGYWREPDTAAPDAEIHRRLYPNSKSIVFQWSHSGN